MEKAIYNIKSLINSLLSLLFPSKCLGCEKRGIILCESCIDNFKLAERPTEERILSLYDYRDPIVKKAIWQLKYYHSPYLGRVLGKLIYDSFLEEINSLQMFSAGSPILVVPVPISHSKNKKRGYNQSEVIAKGFISANPNIFKIKKDIIYKKMNTIPQARIENRLKRLKNVKDSFIIKNSEAIKNKTVIVIDDVTTTGGTLLEIMKLLKKSGAKKIVGFTIAH